jgi:hypothetical protein
LNGITNVLLKLEREKIAKMLIELMKIILNTGFCPSEWENARTILLYKEGNREDQENWRPIIVTSVICKTIF